MGIIVWCGVVFFSLHGAGLMLESILTRQVPLGCFATVSGRLAASSAAKALETRRLKRNPCCLYLSLYAPFNNAKYHNRLILWWNMHSPIIYASGSRSWWTPHQSWWNCHYRITKRGKKMRAISRWQTNHPLKFCELLLMKAPRTRRFLLIFFWICDFL